MEAGSSDVNTTTSARLHLKNLLKQSSSVVKGSMLQIVRIRPFYTVNGEAAKMTADVFQIKVILPHQPYEIEIMVSVILHELSIIIVTKAQVSTQEQVQDLRQSIVEQPAAFQYSCFHLEHHGQKINDYSDLSDVKTLAAGFELRLIEDPYTEKEARMHVVRVRELIGAAGNRVDTLHGISAGVSLHENVLPWCGAEQHNSDRQKPAASKTIEGVNALADFQPQGPPSLQTLIPPAQELLPKTIKALT
ncbi:MAG: hypothetical protein Q9214_006166, partial [Letrouitia sp. 1 TL-2023]